MNVRQIVKQWLKKKGYDGLYSSSECACMADDLMPCGEYYSDCESGYLCPCPSDCEEYHEFHIGPEKYHELEKQV